MQKFRAMFWENQVYINKKHQYLTNEILVRYLNLDTSELEETYDDLRHESRGLLFKTTMTPKAIELYNEKAWNVQKILNRLNEVWKTLPPYDVCLDDRGQYHDQLFKTLNCHQHLFETGIHGGGPTPDSTDYGYRVDEETDQSYAPFELAHFEPADDFEWRRENYLEDLVEDVNAANDDIEAVVDEYLHWIEDMLRVRYVYTKLLNDYLHIRHGFLDEYERARQFAAYLQTEETGSRPYFHIVPEEPQSPMSHEVFEPEKGKTILCESCTFESIGAFLYTDFFRGLPRNHLPKKCKSCGEWFLLPHGKYADYCENPLSGEPDKTCRDVSSRKKFNDKVKNDPVWLAYSRAYKAHYARYKKGKMTPGEFEKWGTWAIEWRDKAQAKKVGFEEYQRQLKI